MEPTDQPMQEPGARLGKTAELRLIRALIDNYDRSPPSQADVENALESGVARLMLLEGRRRAQASGKGDARPGEDRWEVDDLVEEIRGLQEAVAELRACANPGESSPLAHGFVLRRKP